jgi:hypothetical protein
MKHTFPVTLATATLTALLTMPGITHAQMIGAPVSQNVISDTALSNTTGNISVNTTAGSGNAQTSMTAIGISDMLATGTLVSQQQLAPGRYVSSGQDYAAILDQAFTSARGVVKVNQSSGNNNAQANLVGIAAGTLSEVSLVQLSQVDASQQMPNGSSNNVNNARRQVAEIADSAFVGARGVVQVNQVAGSGNSTANLFALAMSAGTP